MPGSILETHMEHVKLEASGLSGLVEDPRPSFSQKKPFLHLMAYPALIRSSNSLPVE